MIRLSCQTSANLKLIPERRKTEREASFCIISKHNVGASRRSWEVIENHELSFVCAGWFPETQNSSSEFVDPEKKRQQKKRASRREQQMEEKSVINRHIGAGDKRNNNRASNAAHPSIDQMKSQWSVFACFVRAWRSEKKRNFSFTWQDFIFNERVFCSKPTDWFYPSQATLLPIFGHSIYFMDDDGWDAVDMSSDARPPQADSGRHGKHFCSLIIETIYVNI